MKYTTFSYFINSPLYSVEYGYQKSNCNWKNDSLRISLLEIYTYSSENNNIDFNVEVEIL